jgi:hypothetical protein
MMEVYIKYSLPYLRHSTAKTGVRVELRASCLIGMSSTIWAVTPDLRILKCGISVTVGEFLWKPNKINIKPFFEDIASFQKLLVVIIIIDLLTLV